jgi:hypothetical protein
MTIFRLEGLPPGQHRLTPVKAGYQFYPPHFTVTITDRDVTGVVFTASGSVHYMLYVPQAQRQ